MIHAVPQFRDVLNTLPNQNGFEKLHNLGNQLRAEVPGIGLPETEQPAISVDLDEGCTAALSAFAEEWVIRARACQQDSLDVCDLCFFNYTRSHHIHPSSVSLEQVFLELRNYPGRNLPSFRQCKRNRAAHLRAESPPN